MDIKWVKITTDIFDDEKILLIESMPDKYALITCWFKLLCLAGKQNNHGVFFLADRIPYTDEMLATIFRMDLNTVRLALDTFEHFGMIEKINGVITIPNWEKHQSADGMDKIREQTRIRVQEYRARQRMLISGQVCQYCGEEATGEDHIIAKARGGSDDEDNKVPCCIRCNRTKNDKPLIDFLNNNRSFVKPEIVMQNPKLTRYVTYCNVTDRFIVTQSNAIEEDKNRKEENKNKGVFQTFAGEDTDLLKALKEFNDFRTKKKKPMTDGAKERLVKKLSDYPKEQWIPILQQSIDKGWTDIYPLEQKGREQKGKNAPVSGKFDTSGMKPFEFG